MKIALVYDCLYPYSKGGVEKRLFDISRRLQANHEVHLFGMKYWYGGGVKKETSIYYHGVCTAKKLYTQKGKRSIWQAIYFSIRLFIALIKKDFDVVDCQNIPYFPAFACKLYCFLRKKILLITWYEVWGNYWYEYLGWKGCFGKLIEKVTTKLTEHNLAISVQTKENYRCISQKPITILPLGIEFAEIQATKASGYQFDVLFVGRLIKEKNVDTLIRSISLTNIPHIRCGIIGDGPERLALEQLTKELKLEGQIMFLGFVNNVYSYMKSSKIFAFPSKREGFGLVVIEANACGLPVILLEHPNNAATDLIDKNGYICKSEDEMAQRITQLLSDNHLRHEISKNSVAVAQKYDWAFLVQQYETFCMRITTESKKGNR